MKSKSYVVFHFLFAWLIRLIFRIRVIGRENEPKRREGSYIVIANHISWADPIFICAATRHQQPHYMAKKELFKVPVLRRLVKSLGAYPVDRGGADVGAVKRSIKLLKDGYSVGVFPQGHRYPEVDPATTPVRSGVANFAIHSGASVLPAYIYTKNGRAKPFCRKVVILGKPISVEEMHYQPEAPGEYARIAALLFAESCRLGEEYRAALQAKKEKKNK